MPAVVLLDTLVIAFEWHIARDAFPNIWRWWHNAYGISVEFEDITLGSGPSRTSYGEILSLLAR